MSRRAGPCGRAFGLAVLGCLITGCDRAAAPATPALWQVTDQAGHSAPLFGTIHALPHPLSWRTPRIAAALAASGELVVEIGNLTDTRAVRAAFLARARADRPIRLETRLPAALAPALARLERQAHLPAEALDRDKSWAAALVLANAASAARPADGVDRALLADNRLPVMELEGAAGQFAMFDALPEPVARRMLAIVVAEAPHAAAATDRLVDAWARGDVAPLAAENHAGLLADPALRAALFEARNRHWARRIAAELRAGRRPFIAVGSAHLYGNGGLIALLARAGFAVRRIA